MKLRTETRAENAFDLRLIYFIYFDFFNVLVLIYFDCVLYRHLRCAARRNNSRRLASYAQMKIVIICVSTRWPLLRIIMQYTV